jgi:hypothetical protein
MSPGISSKASLSLLICSATLQIIWFRLAFCLVWPLTLSQMPPSLKCPICEAMCSGPITAERSKLLPISQGFFSSPIARCRSRRVMSRPIA